MPIGVRTLLGAALTAAIATPQEGLEEQAPVDFGDQVRPILARSCLPCHGFDPSTREADLRLDSFEHATAERRRGRPGVIVPGDPDASDLLWRVSTDDEWDRMPPEGEPLSTEEVELLRRWIEEGASYERHWSLEPLPDRAPEGFGPAAIDAMIESRLEAEGLEVAPRADRRVLARRLWYDLTGLPPSPEELDAFVRDRRDYWYDRQVNDLLASPAFGERWARHWLDLVRYAETHGHEFDYPIPGAWRYRDAVVRAFNADVPYDRFVVEHVAGDLVPDPRIDPATGSDDSLLMTGFWWLGQGTHAPTDVRQDEVERIDNQIDVFSKAFLATTVACARCHDHKFDPVRTADYYALSAYLQSSRRQVAYLDPMGAIAAASDELRAASAEAERALDRALDPALLELAAKLPEQLLAAREVMLGDPTGDEVAAPAAPTLLADFDGATYAGWTVEGEAFGDGPTLASDAWLAGGGTAIGRGFANSHVREADGDPTATDARTGRLIGPEFVIERDWLHFLIGGGDRPGEAELRLVVDGEVVRRATGHDSLELRPERFDLREWRGRAARLEIVDQATGGWGNVRVDELRLADDELLLPTPRRAVEAVARERGLESDTLSRWVELLRGADEGALAPLLEPSIESRHAAARERARELTDWRAARPAWSGGGELWRATGWAFDGLGSWRAPAQRNLPREAALADSGGVADVLQGSLRSPTFEIESPWLMARVRGRGRARLIIDGYHLDEHNGLLFEGVIQDVNTRQWRWVAHDVADYVGHRAYYELVDDSAEGSLELDALRWSQDRRTPEATAADVWLAGLPDAEAETLAASLAAQLELLVAGRVSPVAAQLLREFEGAGLLTVVSDELRTERDRFARIAAGVPGPARAVAMVDGSPEESYVHVRGDYRLTGDAAPRGFLEVLQSTPLEPSNTGSGRLELAQRLVADDNPFTARVIVNRVWHHLFGRGLVRTTDDFGLLGESPSHPELLDALAAHFRTELDWSIKRLIRTLVATEAYRRASAAPFQAERALDELTLLARREPRRMDAEALRDALLTVSGSLDRTVGGPPVPLHLTEFMTGRGRPGSSGPLDGGGRRSLYMEVRRNFLDPVFQAFDAPVPHSTVGCRHRSNVPAQALALMNAPLVRQQAERLAARASAEAPDSIIYSHSPRLTYLFELVLGRRERTEESGAMLTFIEEWAGEDHDPLVEVAHALLNLKEFSFVE